MSFNHNYKRRSLVCILSSAFLCNFSSSHRFIHITTSNHSPTRRSILPRSQFSYNVMFCPEDFRHAKTIKPSNYQQDIFLMILFLSNQWLERAIIEQVHSVVPFIGHDLYYVFGRGSLAVRAIDFGKSTNPPVTTDTTRITRIL